MEIAGYEVDNKMLAIAGAAGLGIIAFISKRSNTDPTQTATLQPAEGLTWNDLISPPKDRGTVGSVGDGGTGLTGPAGPPGVPGLPGKRGPRGKPGKSPKDTKPDRNKDNNDDNNRHHNDRHRVEIPEHHNRGGDPNNGHNIDKPRQRHEHERERRDPRLDTPKQNRRRNEGENRLNDRNHRRETDRERDRGLNRERDSGRDRERERGRGVLNIIKRGGTSISRGRHARSRARGGTVTHGDIDRNTSTHIDVSGGTAISNASGGNGNRTRRRRGAGFQGEDDGFGRADGKIQAAGFVRTNISPGQTTGGFMPMPHPIKAPGDTEIINEGESLKQFSKRVYGYSHFWPRIVALNNTYQFQDREIPAGTVLRIG
jgi:hypothetical protein